MPDTPFLSQEEWDQLVAQNNAIQQSPTASLPPSMGELSSIGYDTAPLAGATNVNSPMSNQADYWLRGGGEGSVNLPDIEIPPDILMQTERLKYDPRAAAGAEAAMVAQAEQMPWDVTPSNTPISTADWGRIASGEMEMPGSLSAQEKAIMEEEEELLKKQGLLRPEPVAFKEMSPEEQLNLIAFLQAAQEKKAEQSQSRILESIPGGTEYDRDFMVGAGILPLTPHSAQYPGNEAVLNREFGTLEDLKQARLNSLIAAAEAVERMK